MPTKLTIFEMRFLGKLQGNSKKTRKMERDEDRKFMDILISTMERNKEFVILNDLELMDIDIDEKEDKYVIKKEDKIEITFAAPNTWKIIEEITQVSKGEEKDQKCIQYRHYAGGMQDIIAEEVNMVFNGG
eukprot:58704_1